MTRILRYSIALMVASLALLAQANSWTYSGNKNAKNGSITDGQWTISVTHVENADTLTISGATSTSQDFETLDLTGDITTKDGQKLTLTGTDPVKWSQGAFYNRANLRTVIFPEGFTTLGSSTFNKCPALVSVTVPSTLQSVGASAFSGCSNLTAVPGLGPREELTIGSNAFAGCSKFEFDQWPTKMIIGEKAFQNCASLTNVIVSAGTIGSQAFYGCTALEKAEIGKGVSDITGVIFPTCNKLNCIRFHGYPSGSLYCDTRYLFIGSLVSTSAGTLDDRYRLRLYVPNNSAEWRTYLSSGTSWESVASTKKDAYYSFYGLSAPAPESLFDRGNQGSEMQVWCFYEEPIATGNVTLTIDGNVKINGTQPVGTASPTYAAAVEYEVGKVPTCSVEATAKNAYGRFDAYGCEIAKRVDSEWVVVTTNLTISGVQIADAQAGEEYRLTWLFNRAYQPQLTPVPSVLGESLGTVTTNTPPSLEELYYPVGSSVTFEATDGAGTFVRWYGNCIPAGHAYDNPITIPVTDRNVALTTSDGPLKIKPFFRSPCFGFSSGKISDGYLTCSAEVCGEAESTDIKLTSYAIPPDGDMDFTKPVIGASSGKKYSIVCLDVRFKQTAFDGDDPADSARRIRFPSTLDRESGLPLSQSLYGGSMSTSYRFLDFSSDISYSTFTNSWVDAGIGDAWKKLITIPNGTWNEILTNKVLFTHWGELNDADKQRWKNLGIEGRRPIGVTNGGTHLWIRYAAAPGLLMFIR